MSPEQHPSKLVIFCGKGGVGKTSISMAFALAQADRGRKTVVVTSHPLQELALAISLEGLKETHPGAAANLFVVYLDPREILNERVKQTIPSALLSRAVLSSRIYRSLIEIAPGLKEIAFLGRLMTLAREHTHDQDARDFDLLVWDAPATGHFLQTLRVSKNFHTYLSGPLAALGADLTDFFSGPSSLLLFVITILEEMAVEETHDLYRSLLHEVGLPPSGLICNMASPWLAASRVNLDKGEQTQPPESLGPLAERLRVERSFFEKLADLAPPDLRVVERVPESEPSVKFLFSISQQLGGLDG